MSKTRSVLASVLHGPRDLRLEERVLEAPGPGEVQVAVQATGLCGSDLHYWTAFRNGDILVREPLTLGHESAGVVSAIGEGAVDGNRNLLQVGDRVALEVGQPCGQCELCQVGRYNICPGMRFRSSAKSFPHAQGTLQEHITHPAKWCYKIPNDLPVELGALAEPLSVALHAADRAPPSEGRTVLVLGAGTVGLLCAAIVKSQRGRVIIADINADRVNFATGYGFADAGVVVPLKNPRPETVDEKLGYAREVADLVRSVRFEAEGMVGDVAVTYECTGVESCLQASIYATKPGGTVMVIGMGNPVQTLPISAAFLREIDLIGVFRYANTYPRAIKLLSSKDPLLPDFGHLITHRFGGLDRITDAFDMASRACDDHGKVVIKVMVNLFGKGYGQ